MFDWISFLSQRRIPYVTRGPNTPRGDISIRCPFCGAADPSEHMVIRLSRRGWHCWRNNKHKGSSPATLIQALLQCSMAEALSITEVSGPGLRSDSMDQVAKLLGPQEEPQPDPVVPVTLPPSFRPFKDVQPARPYLEYLARRSIRIPPPELTKRFDMYYATSGSYKGRVIFAVRLEGQLVSWTGRTIYKNETQRYKALTCDPEIAERQRLEPAAAPVNHYLLWYDRLLQGAANTIVLCEGPMDALQVNILGGGMICATCFFTSLPTKQQVNKLRVLLPRFRNRFLLLDEDAQDKVHRLKDDLQHLAVRVALLPKGVDDPAMLRTPQQLSDCLAQF